MSWLGILPSALGLRIIMMNLAVRDLRAPMPFL
jgi:hypothetical protein